MSYKDAGVKRVYQVNWITARKRKYIEQMGCCVFCGSLYNIQIHHLDSSNKWSHRIWSYSPDIIELELSKCIALCGHCHKMYHALLRHKDIQHGHNTGYRLGCRCAKCRKAHTEVARMDKLKKSAAEESKIQTHQMKLGDETHSR